jgi:hypothetical protein
MAIQFNLNNVNKSTFAVLRTNPKLTGNVKLTVNSSDQIFLSAFAADKILSEAQYQSYELNQKGSYSEDVAKFFKGVSLNTVYKTARKYSDFTPYEDYSFQYEQQYSYGASFNSIKVYEEQYKILAPIWLDRKVPEKFVVYRVKDVDYTESYEESTAGQNSRILELLKNATIVKTFDLTKDSVAGKYLNNHVYNDLIPSGAIQQNYEIDGLTKFRGIDVVNGGFSEKSEYLTRDILQSDLPEIAFNEIISNGFERNGIVSANLINLEFLFDDSNAANYEVYRYFGLYVDESPEGEFTIDTVTQKDLISIQPNSTSVFMESGSITAEDLLPKVEDLQLPTLNYVKSGSGQFFHVKNATHFGELRLPLSIDVNSEILDNYKKDDTIVTIEGAASNKGFIRFNITEAPIHNDRFYLGDLTEMKHASYDLEDFTFIADSSLIAGSFNGLRFSSQGNLVEITKAIKDAITASSISEYYTIYFKGTSIVIEDFAIGNDRDGMSFGIYTQNASQFIEVVSGYDRDMSTLVPSIPVGVSTDFTEWVNYQSAGGSMEGAVKIVSSQEIGKLQKGDFVKKRNSNKFIEVIDIQPNLLDDTTYRVVLKEAVETSRDEVMQTYVKFKTQFGKFAAYDFMDFDFDFYSTDNSNSGELALEEYNSIDATSYFINLTPVLEEEKVEEGIENDVITSEYDRLSENEMKEFAIRSRMVPSIMKFAMKNATNARNLPYILNVSEVFGSNNISPDIDLENGRNVDNLNMEHFHLNQIPEEPYIDIKGLTSYTDLDGMGVSIDQLKSTDVDYFSLYFNFNGAENTATGLWEDSAFKQLYTKFSNGSQILEPSTVFRGLKYLYKKRKEFNQTAPTEFIDSTEANDYKFGVTLNYVVSTDPEDPNSVTYEVVKNDKFKFICVVLTLKVTKNDNYYINRLKLYELNDITISGVPVDTTIPFQIDLNHPDTDWNLPEISVFASDFSQIDGTAAFTEHITADEFDKLSWVYFNTPLGRYCFKVERVINDSQIITFGLPVPFDNVTGPQPDLPPLTPADLALVSPTTQFYYYRGGSSGFKFLLEELVAYNFANRFNQFGDISYTTITVNGEELSDRFVLGVESGSEVVKKSLLEATSDPERPKSYQLNNTEIGKVLRYRKDGGYFTLLRRINGDYNPLFKTVVSFTDIYNSNKLNYPALGDTEVVSNDRTDVIYNYNNGKGISFSSHKNVSEDYGYMKNLFFHKVNDQNVKNLLKLSQTTDKLPLYPKISEIAIDKKDMNLFKSKYSQDFFTKSLAGGGSNLVHGTLSPVEVKAFFASTIMKVKDNYDITAYSPKQENDLDSLDYIRVNKLNTNSVHWFENDTEIVADFYLPQSVKDELLEDGILSKFAKYVEPQNSYRDKTTIEDDLSVYIYQNVVPRFIIDSIEIYALEGKNLSTEFVSTTDVTGLTANGYRIQTNYEVETYQNDSLSFRLIYKKRLGYNYSLKVLVKIEA